MIHIVYGFAGMNHVFLIACNPLEIKIAFPKIVQHEKISILLFTAMGDHESLLRRFAGKCPE